MYSRWCVWVRGCSFFLLLPDSSPSRGEGSTVPGVVVSFCCCRKTGEVGFSNPHQVVVSFCCCHNVHAEDVLQYECCSFFLLLLVSKGYCVWGVFKFVLFLVGGGGRKP